MCSADPWPRVSFLFSGGFQSRHFCAALTDFRFLASDCGQQFGAARVGVCIAIYHTDIVVDLRVSGVRVMACKWRSLPLRPLTGQSVDSLHTHTSVPLSSLVQIKQSTGAVVTQD